MNAAMTPGSDIRHQAAAILFLTSDLGIEVIRVAADPGERLPFGLAVRPDCGEIA